MENLIEYKFIGWNNEGIHDKIWTSFLVNDDWYCAWGRRGAKLSFKHHGKESLSWSLLRSRMSKLEQQKRAKGYKEVDEFMLFSIFPNFKDELEQQLLMKTLSGDIR